MLPHVGGPTVCVTASWNKVSCTANRGKSCYQAVPWQGCPGAEPPTLGTPNIWAPGSLRLLHTYRCGEPLGLEEPGARRSRRLCSCFAKISKKAVICSCLNSTDKLEWISQNSLHWMKTRVNKSSLSYQLGPWSSERLSGLPKVTQMWGSRRGPSPSLWDPNQTDFNYII